MLTNSLSLTDRFTWLLEGLCKVIGAEAHQRRMEAALAWAIWNRVRLLGERLVALVARARAGRLPACRPAGASPRAGSPRTPPANASAGGLPREFGWMVRLLPRTAQFAGVLSFLLREPEVAALVETAPQAGRILRPLCHMLGVKAPEFLRARRGRDASPAPQAATEGGNGEGAAGGPVSAAAHAPSPPPEPDAAGANGADDAASQLPTPAPPPPAAAQPQRPLNWLEQHLQTLRERAARPLAMRANPPSTLLPLGLSPELDFPGTRQFGSESKNRS